MKKIAKKSAGKPKIASKKTGVLAKLGGAASKISQLKGGAKRGGGFRRGGRRKSPEYWAKKVLVEKLKKRYFKIKYGGVR